MKINVGVFFGGKSVEHEVSVITAVEAMNALDQNKYNVIPIYITKEGEFYTSQDMLDIKVFKDIPALLDKSTNVTISVNEREHSVINNESGLFFKKVIAKLDVAFPIMHGTNGEDGTLQGLFELMNIPYVGSNVVASANGMDKITMKMILKESGLPTVPYLWFFSNTYFDDKETILRGISDTLKYPVIVKPANLGSSVGIATAKNMQELEEAIDTATSYSNKIIVEKMVENLREINVSVLGDYEQSFVSMCEEPLRSGDILSYNDKYAVGAKGGAKGAGKGMAASYHKMPADLSEELSQKIKAYAKMTFISLNCSGIARVDFLLDSSTNDVYVNEINTIPGSLSYYFWEAAGMPFSALLDKLIELAVKKHKEKNKLIFTNNINILSLSGKGPKKNTNNEYDMNNNASYNPEDIEMPNSIEDEEIVERKVVTTLDKLTKDINEDYDYEENPLLNEEDIPNEEMVQISLDENNQMEFEKVLDSKMSQGNTIDEIVDDNYEDIEIPEFKIVSDEDKEALEIARDLENESKVNNAPDIKVETKKLNINLDKLNSLNNNTNTNVNGEKQVKKNTSEPFGLLKMLTANKDKEVKLNGFENPDAFSNGDLKIKGVKNNKKKNNQNKTANKAQERAALDEFFSDDNN